MSGRPDSNRRPLDPQSSALPSCATSRCHRQALAPCDSRYSLTHDLPRARIGPAPIAGPTSRGRPRRIGGSLPDSGVVAAGSARAPGTLRQSGPALRATHLVRRRSPPDAPAGGAPPPPPPVGPSRLPRRRAWGTWTVAVRQRRQPSKIRAVAGSEGGRRPARSASGPGPRAAGLTPQPGRRRGDGTRPEGRGTTHPADWRQGRQRAPGPAGRGRAASGSEAGAAGGRGSRRAAAAPRDRGDARPEEAGGDKPRRPCQGGRGDDVSRAPCPGRRGRASCAGVPKSPPGCPRSRTPRGACARRTAGSRRPAARW